MNVLSLFDGISCGQVALERAGIKYNSYFASEIDKYAIQITHKNYPNTINVGDVQFVTGQQFSAIGGIDLLIGGSPCQGFSFAGKQLNFKDPRSALFFEFVRLKRELNPKWFLLENVKMKKEYQDVISEYLGVQPIEINSSIVSAQNRKRLYWTNIPSVKQPEDKGILLKNITVDDWDKIAAMRGGYNENGNIVQKLELRKDFKTNTITSVQKDNYVVKKIANINPSGNGMNGCVYDVNYKSPTITTNKGEGSKIGIPIQINNEPFSDTMKQPSIRKRIYHINGKSPALLADFGDGYKVGLINDEYFIYRKLFPIECERLQTLPDNYTEGVSDSQRYKALGNGWTVDVIAHIFKNIK